MPTVSIIIPTHNRANCLVNYLQDAIESVLAQSYADYELIVVDDGSEDNTQALLQSYGDRLRPLSHNRRCTAASLNLGVSRSTGRYVAFLDDDDLWRPDKLEVQVKSLEGDPGLGFVGNQATFVDDRGGPTLPAPAIGGSEEESFANLFERTFIPASSGVIRRELFEQVSGFDETLYTSHDYDLWLRASRIARFRQIGEPLTTCRVHPPHSTRKDAAQKLNDRLQVIRKAGQEALVGFWARRSRMAKEYYRHAIDCEDHGQHRAAAYHYRKAALTFPLIGVADTAPPGPRSAASPLLRLLRPFLKGASLRQLADETGPDTDGDIIRVRPDEIRLKIAKPLDWYLKAGDTPSGDWDLQPTDVTEARKYRSVIQHFQAGVDWEDTVIFRTSYAEALNRGEAVLGTRGLDQLAKRYRSTVDPLFHAMKTRGFVLEFNRKGNCITDLPHVHVGRDGQILFGRNGNHRLAMAKVLGLPRFFCRVRARHEKWEQIREMIRRCGPQECWSILDRRLAHHPDLQDLLDGGGGGERSG